MSQEQLDRSIASALLENAGFRHPGPGGSANVPWPGSHKQYPPNSTELLHIPPAKSPEPGDPQQEATVYQKHCNKCSWKSLPSYDPRAYVGAVADYEFHVKDTHSEQKDNGEFSTHNKDTEEFEKATRLRDVTIVKDDCNLNLCEARYWRQPLSWTNSQLNLPVDQKPICTVGDYEPYGMEINNKQLIKALHSRSNKTTNKLKYFSDPNLKVIPSQQENLITFDKANSGQLLTTKEWKELNSEKEAIKAAHNYCELMRAIHPLDSGPQILFKVMLEKFLSGGTTSKQLEEFFNSVTWELANRAAKSQLPYRYAELQLKWDQSYRNSYHAQISVKDDRNLSEIVSDTVKRTMKNLNIRTPTKKPRQTHNWCPDYNKEGGCSNTKTETGCKDGSDKVLKHGCSVRKANGRMCNSAEHNRQNHT